MYNLGFLELINISKCHLRNNHEIKSYYHRTFFGQNFFSLLKRVEIRVIYVKMFFIQLKWIFEDRH